MPRFMPRQNASRSINAEQDLAALIARERERRGWSYDHLARLISDAGCPIQGSALFKIEKGQPPRRITVDELVALTRVFAMNIDQLLAAETTCSQCYDAPPKGWICKQCGAG